MASSPVENLIRVGVVTSTNPAAATVRVAFDEKDDLTSYDYPVLVRKVHRDKDYWMPDVGDHVLCLTLPNGLEQGFVVGAFYSKADRPKVQSQDKKRVDFDDGAWVEYDRAQRLLDIYTPGKIHIVAVQGVFIEADVEVTGKIHATETIIDDKGNTNHHGH